MARFQPFVRSGVLRVLFLCMMLGAMLCPMAQPSPADGRYTERYENGQARVKGHYKKGRKHRNWFYYRPGGVLEKREQWKNGVLNATYLYNENGRLQSITGKNGQTRSVPCNCH